MLADPDLSVCVLGLGYIGLPTAAVIARSGARVPGRGAALACCPVMVVLVDHDLFRSVPAEERARKAVLDTRGIWPDQPRPQPAPVALRLAG